MNLVCQIEGCVDKTIGAVDVRVPVKPHSTAPLMAVVEVSLCEEHRTFLYGLRERK